MTRKCAFFTATKIKYTYTCHWQWAEHCGMVSLCIKCDLEFWSSFSVFLQIYWKLLNLHYFRIHFSINSFFSKYVYDIFADRFNVASGKFCRSVSPVLRRRLAFVGGRPDQREDPLPVGRILEGRCHPERQRSSKSHDWFCFKR